MKGKIIAVCISDTKGVRKTPCPSGMFLEDYGMANDAHAECGIKRQVSLLSVDSIEKMKNTGLAWARVASRETVPWTALSSTPFCHERRLPLAAR